MSEPEGDTGSPPGASSEGAKKRLSPIEMLRAKAAAKAAESGAAEPGKAAEPAPAGASDKPAEGTSTSSKLAAIRAAAAAKKQQEQAGDAAPTPKAESPAAKPAEAKEKPVAKPVATKPPVKPRGAEAAPTRRGFLVVTWIGTAWAAFSAGCGAALLGTVRFLYPNVLQEPPNVFKVGAPDKYEDGNVYEQYKNEYGVWIIRNQGELYAIRTVCTHLGCTPNWLEGEQKFKCPCHGSGFRKTGINFEGPAPRPLERYHISIADDGQVQIDKSRKFQKELGQWTEENGAFIKLA